MRYVIIETRQNEIRIAVVINVRYGNRREPHAGLTLLQHELTVDVLVDSQRRVVCAIRYGVKLGRRIRVARYYEVGVAIIIDIDPCVLAAVELVEEFTANRNIRD
jgi:hypothetical protein